MNCWLMMVFLRHSYHLHGGTWCFCFDKIRIKSDIDIRNFRLVWASVVFTEVIDNLEWCNLPSSLLHTVLWIGENLSAWSWTLLHYVKWYKHHVYSQHMNILRAVLELWFSIHHYMDFHNVPNLCSFISMAHKKF